MKSSRSTVATMADIEPYFCALFAREAVPICPDHGVPAVRIVPPYYEHPAYLAKYTERIAALFGTPEQFATLFSAALIITPAKLHT